MDWAYAMNLISNIITSAIMKSLLILVNSINSFNKLFQELNEMYWTKLYLVLRKVCKGYEK